MNSSNIPTGLNFASQKQLEELQHINLQLASLGLPTCEVEGISNISRLPIAY